MLLNENSALKVHVRKLEIEVADNLKYQRGNNIVLSGISTDVVDELLEPTVIDILKKIDVVVSQREIEAVHTIWKDRKRTIVCFVNRKDAVAALNSRAKLKGTNLFVEENFCPSLARLGFMWRKLKREEILFSTWMRNGLVFVKVKERDKPKIIKHTDELLTAYLDFDFY